MIETGAWSEVDEGKLSVNILKEKYSEGNYLVSPYSYPAGTEFPGSMRDAVCYVISGNCCYRFDESSISLSSGQYAKLPKGSYVLEIGSEMDLELVLVWDLSKLR